MDYAQLTEQIFQKRSMLCVGLDTDREKLLSHIKSMEDPVFFFNKQIIEATHELTVAYKLNTAFYEAEGIQGLQAMEKTLRYLQENYPKILTLADAKRGDIGNTSDKYAQAYFSHYDFDGLTISPYMGSDAVIPYLAYDQKWLILLALTSNPSAVDFQEQKLIDGSRLYETVIQKSLTWGDHERIMYVVGATRSDKLSKIRGLLPQHFLLIPGIGHQKGEVREVVEKAATSFGGLLINVSRAILYAGKEEDFALQAHLQAKNFVTQMRSLPPLSHTNT